MNKEARRKIFFLLIRSKILLPGFLLFVAWIITIFTFYIYQMPKTSVEGIAIKKFSNLQPSPIIFPTPTIFVIDKEQYSNSINPTIAVSTHTTISPVISHQDVSNTNSNANNAKTPTTQPNSDNVSTSPSVPTTVPTSVTFVITTPVPSPTSASAGNTNGSHTSNCVNNGSVTICQTFSPQVSPAGSSTGGTTGVGVETGNAAQLNGNTSSNSVQSRN